jgi:hypothetical protein
MDEQIIELFLRHVGMAFDQQLKLGEFLEGNTKSANWNYTISTGTLEFGTAIRFEAHDLGSHAFPDNSWFWAWCNPQLKLTAANQELGQKAQALGEKLGIQALTAKRYFDLGPVLDKELSEHAAHIFGIICSREFSYDAYYTMPFDNGRMVTLIRDNRLQFVEDHPIIRIQSVFPQVISALPVPNHHSAFMAYAQAYGLEVTSEQNREIVVNAKGNRLTASFDTSQRLTELKSTVGAKKNEKK